MRLNNYRTRPQLTGPCTRVGDRGSPCHSRALRRVGIEFPGPHNFHALLLPVQCVPPSQIEGLRTEYPSTAFQMQVCYEGRTESVVGKFCFANARRLTPLAGNKCSRDLLPIDIWSVPFSVFCFLLGP